MIGFACTETPEYMPLTISLAHKLCRRLAEVRKDGTLDYLRPDGKSQVTVEYAYGVPRRVEAVVLAAQHDAVVSHDVLEQDLTEQVIRHVIPANLLDDRTKYFINPTGRFVVGGPMGDAGLTGRKIIVDTYGGIARHGGGAFSGKDPTKVDRSAAYAARYVAKNLVAAGLADRMEVRSPMPSAWRAPRLSPSRPSAPTGSTRTSSSRWCTSTSTCVRPPSSAT